MRRVAVIGLIILLGWLPAAAEPKTGVSHGLTLLDKLKYGPDFKHLEYVNPNAPKGGAVKRFSIGSFDSLNPFILKGQAVSFIIA